LDFRNGCARHPNFRRFRQNLSLNVWENGHKLKEETKCGWKCLVTEVRCALSGQNRPSNYWEISKNPTWSERFFQYKYVHDIRKVTWYSHPVNAREGYTYYWYWLWNVFRSEFAFTYLACSPVIWQCSYSGNVSIGIKMPIYFCEKNDFVISVKDIHKSSERVWYFIDYMGAPLIILSCASCFTIIVIFLMYPCT
jgi:hypothetical protein